MKKQTKKEDPENFYFSINSNNPYEYYGTDDINEIPEHLREECKKYDKQ